MPTDVPRDDEDAGSEKDGERDNQDSNVEDGWDSADELYDRACGKGGGVYGFSPRDESVEYPAYGVCRVTDADGARLWVVVSARGHSWEGLYCSVEETFESEAEAHAYAEGRAAADEEAHNRLVRDEQWKELSNCAFGLFLERRDEGDLFSAADNFPADKDKVPLYLICSLDNPEGVTVWFVVVQKVLKVPGQPTRDDFEDLHRFPDFGAAWEFVNGRIDVDSGPWTAEDGEAREEGS